MGLIRNDGVLELRADERQPDAGLLQLPPRNTRDEPDTAPKGSLPPNGESDQSRHHSHTFPCVSYRPHAVA